MRIFVTGDTHGRGLLKRLEQLHDPQDEALIVLGDVGLNFYLDKRDEDFKQAVQDTGFRVYCVRGNHEARPQDIEHMTTLHDGIIDGLVYYQEAYPNIRYLMDGFDYRFNGHTALVIGGAYSVDKWQRLMYGYKWFPNEQLSELDMADILSEYAGESFDFVLTHTCPYSWRPTELFLRGLDDSTVDTTMESWMEDVKDVVNYKAWLFGHFHGNKRINDKAYMLFDHVVDIEEFLHDDT